MPPKPRLFVGNRVRRLAQPGQARDHDRPPADFVPELKTKATQSELRELYDKYVTVYRKPYTPEPGFLAGPCREPGGLGTYA